MSKFWLALFLIPIVIIPVSGYTEGYEDSYNKLDKPAFVCVLEPDYMVDTLPPITLRNVKEAVDEWKTSLQYATHDKANLQRWDIGYAILPITQQDKIDYEKCSIIIKFEPKSSANESDSYNTEVGVTSWEPTPFGTIVKITIYYLDPNGGLCEVANDNKYRYYRGCYSSDVILPEEMVRIIQHELGHAFGLGHYVTDDPYIYQRWVDGTLMNPSIMTKITSTNPDRQKITQRDIDAIRSLYGQEGWNHVKVKINPPNNNTRDDPLFKDFFIMWVNNRVETSSVIDGFNHFLKLKIGVDKLLNYDSKIPTWFKNPTQWWIEGKITDNEFLNELGFLIEKRIIT